jgi:AraC-like DNA-binding protein
LRKTHDVLRRKGVNMISGMVRSIALRGCHNLIAELGGSPERVARAAGIPNAAFTDPDMSIDGAALASYFELAAMHCSTEDFGLRLARRQGLQILGPIWVLARSAATVREALADICGHMGYFSSMVAIRLQEESVGFALDYELRAPGSVSTRQSVELGLASVCLELRASLGAAWRPLAVQFRHAAPADTSSHRQIFGDMLLFNQDRNALLLDRDSAQRPMRDQNDRAYRAMSGSLRLQSPGDTPGDEVQVELAVRALLPSGRFDLPAVATEIGVCSRTLQLRLKRRGTSFQAIVDAVRIELAEKYLRQSRLSAAEIAELLHFADSSALSRFMRTKAGATPSEIRRSAGQGAASVAGGAARPARS